MKNIKIQGFRQLALVSAVCLLGLLLGQTRCEATTVLPKGVVPTAIEITTLSSKTGAPYVIFANGRHEAPLYINVTANKPLTNDDIVNATTLFNYNTKLDYNRDDAIPSTKSFPVYSAVNNNYDEEIPASTFNTGYSTNALPLLSDGKSVGTLYFKTNKATTNSVCARIIYTDPQDISKTLSMSTCTAAISAPVTVKSIQPKIYSASSFKTHAKYLSYYSWTVNLNWMYDINTYEFTAALESAGYYIKTLTDATGGNGKKWPDYGWNNDLAEGMGGYNDGVVDASNYPEGQLTEKHVVRFDNSTSWTQLYNASQYRQGQEFYVGSPHAFYIGTWHSPYGYNWGDALSHEMDGLDNFGNDIKVALMVCAGTAASDGKCNT